MVPFLFGGGGLGTQGDVLGRVLLLNGFNKYKFYNNLAIKLPP